MFDKSTELAEMIKEKEKSDRLLIKAEWVICILSLIILFTAIYIGDFFSLNEKTQTILILLSLIPVITGFIFALRIEQIAGYYECKYCKHKYIPTFKAIILSSHMGRTRYLKCPKCNEKSWQKKVLKKD